MKAVVQRTTATVEQRCQALEQGLARIASGCPITQVWLDVAQQTGAALRTVRRWYGLIEGAPRSEWPERLRLNYVPKQHVHIPEAAWAAFLQAYQTTQPASMTQAYVATREAAAENGWSIPGLATFRRRLNEAGGARHRYRERYTAGAVKPV